MVLVGPSGFRKTTALRMVAGLERYRRGDDPDRRPSRELRARQGPRHREMVFQSRRSTRTSRGVRQHRLRPAAAAGAEERDRRPRARGRADASAWTEFLDRRLGALSGGQRQRLPWGARSCAGPQVFPLDEPLSNSTRSWCRCAEISQMNELGTTTIYVTHDQVEALTMGTGWR